MKKSSTILKHVRKLIENGDYYYYICYAIDHLEHMGKINPSVARRLKGHVMSQLDGCTSYDSWIRVHHGRLFVVAHNALGTLGLEAKFREGRLAWIDHMIAEFKKQGD